MHFIICGGGIGGLATACALRAEGRQVTVLERSKQLGEIGAAIQMKPNATRWLESFGIDVPSLKGVEVTRVTQYTRLDAPMMHQPIHATKMFGHPWLLTHRADLHAGLKAQALSEADPKRGPPATIVTGVKITDVNPASGTVIAVDGRTWKGDVVIGADGINSAVRKSLFPHAPAPVAAMQAAYRALIPRAAILDEPKLAPLLDPAQAGMVVWVGEDRRVVTYPCRDCDFINIVAIFPDPALVPEAQTHANNVLGAATQQLRTSWPASLNRPSSTEELAADFPDFPAHVRALLSKAVDVSVWQLRDMDALPRWATERAVIVGDAAHAMLPHMGQGGSTAIEDAAAMRYIFQGAEQSEVEFDPTSLPAVSARLRAFEKLRLERIHAIQDYSRAQGQPKVDEAKGHTMNALQFSKFAFGWPGFPAKDGNQEQSEGVRGATASFAQLDLKAGAGSASPAIPPALQSPIVAAK
ncbi:hypothetical protein OC835_002944 [Tilletia horrida]|nr:hypothetical protein OC835_002944 [Tilletia horrida]